MSLPIPVLPSTSNFKIASTVTNVGEVTLPSTVSSGAESRSASHYANRPDGLNGSIFERAPAFEPIEFNLSGPITDDSIIANLKQIIGLGRVQITRDFNHDPPGYTLNGDITSWTLKERVYDSVWDFSMSVQSNQYYWSGGTITSSANPSTVTNGGDFSVYPVLKFTGGAGGATVLTVDINGGIATFTGTVASGELLIIDCDRLIVTLEGANSLDSMNAEFYSSPPILYPGSNTITTTVTGTASLEIEFTERHL